MKTKTFVGMRRGLLAAAVGSSLIIGGCGGSSSSSDDPPGLDIEPDGLLFSTEARVEPLLGFESLETPPVRHGDPRANEPEFVDTSSDEGEGIETLEDLGRFIFTEGWERVERNPFELTGGDGRGSVFYMLHAADAQIVDEKSPALIPASKFAAPPVTTTAYRSVNPLIAHSADALIRGANRIQSLSRDFDLAVHAGDALENAQENELDWFLTLMNGGTFTPVSANTIALDLASDLDPQAPIEAPGLDAPWLSATGNHDVLILGNFPVGAMQFVNSEGERADRYARLFGQNGLSIPNVATGDERRDQLEESEFYIVPVNGPELSDLISWQRFHQAFNDYFAGGDLNPRLIEADEGRAHVDLCGFVQAHLDSDSQLQGHGYTEELNSPNEDGYCVGFHAHVPESADWLRVVTLDTANIYGGAAGVVGRPQAPLDEDGLEIDDELSDELSTTAEGRLNRPGDEDAPLFSVPSLQGEALDDDVGDPARDQIAFLEDQLQRAEQENQLVMVHSHNYSGSLTQTHPFRLFLEQTICEGFSLVANFGVAVDCDASDGSLSTGDVGAPVRGVEGGEGVGNRQALDFFASVITLGDETEWAELTQQQLEDGVDLLNGFGGMGDLAVDAFEILFQLRSVMPDPVGGLSTAEFREKLAESDRVIAHLAGHAHRNIVTAVCADGATIAATDAGETCADKGVDNPARGYFEVVSAGSLERPMEWRVVELVDNGNDTLSIFGTTYSASGDAFFDKGMQLALADVQVDAASPKLDEPGDVNVELRVALPEGFSAERLADATSRSETIESRGLNLGLLED